MNAFVFILFYFFFLSFVLVLAEALFCCDSVLLFQLFPRLYKWIVCVCIRAPCVYCMYGVEMSMIFVVDVCFSWSFSIHSVTAVSLFCTTTHILIHSVYNDKHTHLYNAKQHAYTFVQTSSHTQLSTLFVRYVSRVLRLCMVKKRQRFSRLCVCACFSLMFVTIMLANVKFCLPCACVCV